MVGGGNDARPADARLCFADPLILAGEPLEVAAEVVGAKATVRLPNPVMGAEDFSYVLNRVPGAMVFLGGTGTDRNPATAAPNHSNRVMFDEAAMVNGVAVYSAMALRHLSGPPS